MERPAPAATALLLLAELPPPVAAAAGRLRALLAPAAATRMPAHCTLFRHLPGPSAECLIADVRRLVRAHRAPAMRIGAPVLKERAVLLPVEAPALLELRAELVDGWAPMLLGHERGVPRLHVTLAAGLDAAAGRAALAEAVRAAAHLPFIGVPLACWALVLVPHDPAGAAPLLRAAFRP